MAEIRKSKYNSTSILPHTDNTNKYTSQLKTNDHTENIIQDNILGYNGIFQFPMKTIFSMKASLISISTAYSVNPNRSKMTLNANITML